MKTLKLDFCVFILGSLNKHICLEKNPMNSIEFDFLKSISSSSVPSQALLCEVNMLGTTNVLFNSDYKPTTLYLCFNTLNERVISVFL